MRRFFLFTLLLTGCAVVTFEKPFENSKLTDDEMEQLSGTYISVSHVNRKNHRNENDDIAYSLKFDKDGAPVLAFVHWENGDFHFKKPKVSIAKREGAYYLAVDTGGPQEPHYVFLKLELTETIARLYLPNAAWFGRKIEAGEIDGEKNDKGRIVLKGDPTKTIDMAAKDAAAFTMDDGRKHCLPMLEAYNVIDKAIAAGVDLGLERVKREAEGNKKDDDEKAETKP